MQGSGAAALAAPGRQLRLWVRENPRDSLNVCESWTDRRGSCVHPEPWAGSAASAGAGTGRTPLQQHHSLMNFHATLQSFCYQNDSRQLPGLAPRLGSGCRGFDGRAADELPGQCAQGRLPVH